MKGALWGAIVGDALGVPVEFLSREEISTNPVIDMRGFGTHYQPPGTWSDDSSMILCTTQCFVDGFDIHKLGQLFCRWMKYGYWTPYECVFDMGISTRESLRRVSSGVEPHKSGGQSIESNGNGSLMRILPVPLYYQEEPIKELVEYIHEVSMITHAHPRSLMSCAYYSILVSQILRGEGFTDSYHQTNEIFRNHYKETLFYTEISHFDRILNDNIGALSEQDIYSTGYVIHTLETALWCMINSKTFKEAVLKAVNLGDDTDTSGCVTGGLAGAVYGINHIPVEWLSSLSRSDDIKILIEEFISKVIKAET